MSRVKDKVAIITGAARGMGEAFARALVAEGAKVVLADVLDEEGENVAKELGSNARFMHLDVTQEAQWQQVVDKTEKVFGAVSVLVNNAGISHVCPLESYTENDYRHVIDTNLMSVFFGMKSVLPSMKPSGGSIINISSSAGLTGLQNASAYTAAKFAVRGMSKSAALELAPFNIRVNSVHPGFIETPMTVSSPETQAIVKEAVQFIPAARLGKPEEVAAIVLMLASDESRYSTGAEFIVDGGWTSQ